MALFASLNYFLIWVFLQCGVLLEMHPPPLPFYCTLGCTRLEEYSGLPPFYWTPAFPGVFLEIHPLPVYCTPGSSRLEKYSGLPPFYCTPAVPGVSWICTPLPFYFTPGSSWLEVYTGLASSSTVLLHFLEYSWICTPPPLLLYSR